MTLSRKYLCLLLPVLALAGCDRNNPPPAAVSPQGEVKVDPAKYVSKSEPADAKDVIATRNDAKDGDPIVIVGRIGGSKTPVSDDRAMFTIVDLSLKSCEDDPNCWDFV